MRFYRCSECGEIFGESDFAEKRICMETYYGVEGEFPDHTYSYITVCPACGCEDYDICTPSAKCPEECEECGECDNYWDSDFPEDEQYFANAKEA